MTDPLCLIDIAVEPKSEDDEKRLAEALAELTAIDESFATAFDAESGQTILKGNSETHLDDLLGILINTYGIGLRIGAPSIAYLETITRTAMIDHTHKRVDGRNSQFARVMLTFEPGARGSGFVFRSAVTGGVLREAFIPGVAKGLEAARQNGLVAGYPVTDIIATLTDGKFHDLDSSPLAFEVAAAGAFKKLRGESGAVLLEPVMRLEIAAPADRLAVVIADLAKRRGVVTSQTVDEGKGDLTGRVPLANLFGYGNILPRLSQDRATWTMTFDHYAPVSTPEPPDDVFPPAIGMRA